MPIISQSVTITPPILTLFHNTSHAIPYMIHTDMPHPISTFYATIHPYPPHFAPIIFHHTVHISSYYTSADFASRTPIASPIISPPFLHLQPHLQTVGYIFNGIFKPKKIKKHTKFFCPLKNKSYLCIAFGKCTIPTAS